ncbi:Metallo-hydrolase/oxidoreductase [Mycena venus]|uniref:Metallo-hydrolase/oxidoreductase n=1 Tax=Mycena venus TaxID=2733690 RepID=A0A8H6YIQ2_9AGAR|nr:Metallo-hydrolase/oxidoreductase [Mycena venus]
MQLIRVFSVLSLAAGGLACGPLHAHDAEHEVVARDTLKIAPGPSDTQIQFAPVPSIVDPAPIDPTLGYFVGDLGGGVHWVTEGAYSNMFLVSTHGVIVVDAPPTIGRKLLYAIGNTTHLPVTHLVYSHFHADHIGGASLFNASHPTIIAHAETLSLLSSLSPRDPLRPLPHVTFQGNYTLRVGNQTLELSYHGPNHAPGNLFMYAPAQRVALLIDVVFPGWAPFSELGISTFIPGWTAAHDVLLTFDFDVFVAGHVSRLGTKDDVLLQKKYIEDMHDSCAAAINGGFDVSAAIGPTIAANPGNTWAEFKAYLRVAAQTCADNTTSRWLGVLGAVDVFAFESAYRMIESLRVESDVLGPFGVS